MAENSPPTEEKQLSPAEKAKLAAAKKQKLQKKLALLVIRLLITVMVQSQIQILV